MSEILNQNFRFLRNLHNWTVSRNTNLVKIININSDFFKIWFIDDPTHHIIENHFDLDLLGKILTKGI